MDNLSTSYDFAMNAEVVDSHEPESCIVADPALRTTFIGIEHFIEGLDAYAAVYEPAGC